MEPALSASRFREVIVDSTLRADAIARRRRKSLSSGCVDHFFHYQGLRQAQLWLEVHRAHAPRFHDPSLDEPYLAVADAVAKLLPDADVVALGPGSGTKERLVLASAGRAGRKPRYAPVDASVELALLSADAAEGFAGETVPVAGDLSLAPDLRVLLDRRWGARPRTLTAFGLSPNAEPSRFFPALGSLLRAGDLLLVSANLAPGDETETEAGYARACAAVASQYDNAETRRWLRQILVDWDLEGRLSPVTFAVQAIEGINGFVASARWLEDATFAWEGEPLEVRAGAPLRLFFSLRYTPARFERMLERYGLTALERALDRTGQEGVWIVRRR